MERWRAQLNITGEHSAEENQEGLPQGEDGAEGPVADEYAYLPENAAKQQGDTQALAAATEDQAQEAQAVQPLDGDAAMEEADEVYPTAEPEEQLLPPGERVSADQTLKPSKQAGVQSTMNLEPQTEPAELGDTAAEQDVEMSDPHLGIDQDVTGLLNDVTLQDSSPSHELEGWTSPRPQISRQEPLLSMQAFLALAHRLCTMCELFEQETTDQVVLCEVIRFAPDLAIPST